MGKPQAVTVPSDDCTVEINGEEFHPHEGEWVKVLPGVTVGQLKLMHALAGIETQVKAAQGEPDETARTLALLAGSMDGIIGALRGRVLGWSWTGMEGSPLPQPADDPNVFQQLTTHELMYLVAAIQGETAGPRKNA